MVVCGGDGEQICRTLMEATRVLDVGALAWSQCSVSSSRSVRDDLPVRVPPEDACPRCRMWHSTAVSERSAPAHAVWERHAAGKDLCNSSHTMALVGPTCLVSQVRSGGCSNGGVAQSCSPGGSAAAPHEVPRA